MCGRFAIVEPEKIQSRFQTTNKSPILTPLFNIAPGYVVPLITQNSPNKIHMMKWGLIPGWAKDPKIGYSMINARDDSLLTKNSFKIPFLKQRCLVPASGFYEWKHVDSKSKIPYYFKRADDNMIAFAGLYNVWKDAEGVAIATFTIITTEANETVKPVHDRMPVILNTVEENTWLNIESSKDELLQILKPYRKEFLTSFVVSDSVNNPRNNTISLINPI